MNRPSETEYVPYFAGYVGNADDEVFGQLERQESELSRSTRIPEQAASDSSSRDEWSLKEVVQHLCDFERVFAYRALRASRGDTTPLASFAQDPYVATSGANRRTVADLIEEFAGLRRSTIRMFMAMDEEMLSRAGTSGREANVLSVRALLFIIAGHCEGHLDDLRKQFPELRRST